jgi:hypothetical protein
MKYGIPALLRSLAAAIVNNAADVRLTGSDLDKPVRRGKHCVIGLTKRSAVDMPARVAYERCIHPSLTPTCLRSHMSTTRRSSAGFWNREFRSAGTLIPGNGRSRGMAVQLKLILGDVTGGRVGE